LLYILTGPDDFSLSQALEQIKRDLGDPETLATSTTVLDGRQVVAEQLKTICETVPFLCQKRLVIITGLLDRFETRSQGGRQRRTASTSQPGEHKSFVTCLKSIPESTIVVLKEGNIRKENPLLRELTNKAVVRTFPLLKDVRLRQWIESRVAKEGGSISPEAVGLLTRLVGSNLWIMTSEIGKLMVFAAGRRIEEEDVGSLVSYAQETQVFDTVDAIVEFRAELAERLLQRQLERGAAPAYLLFMLSRQFRMIVRARELSNQKIPESEIQNRLGLSSEFALRKTLEQARRYSLGRLREVYARLLEADLSIKTGRYEGEFALNILVAELCQQGKAGVAHGDAHASK
jgi:DNA polymerase-3 subunit delta